MIQQTKDKEYLCGKVHPNSKRLLVHYLNNSGYMEKIHILLFLLGYLYQQ
jgi:hypothetical protein